MMNISGKKALLITILLLVSLDSFAITFKIASEIPKGSEWERVLMEIAGEWNEATGGRVKLQLYSGPAVGNENDMIRRMSLGQFHGAIVSGTALNKISSGLILLSMPMFIRNNSELEYLLDNQGDDFKALLSDQGFTIIGWQFLGWIYFYSKKPLYTPEDLLSGKLSVAQGDLDIQNVWQSMGFQIVPASTNEIMMGLQTGRIDTLYAPPIMAAANQWFGLAPYMSELPFSPLLAAFLFSNKAWEKVPEEYREELLAITEKHMESLVQENMKLSEDATDIMLKNGLKICKLNDQQKIEWEELFIKAQSRLAGSNEIIPEDLYKKAERLLAEYRSANE